jgi:hypothetical protein
MYGRGATFESLVKKHGRGIPIRAILDELLRIDAVELKPGQKIFPKKCVAVDQMLTARNISISCDLAFKVLSATLRSVKTSGPSVVTASTLAMKLSTNDASSLQAEASAKANALLAGLKQKLKSKQERSRNSDQALSVRLTIAMVFTNETPKRIETASKKRRNFRRGEQNGDS